MTTDSSTNPHGFKDWLRDAEYKLASPRTQAKLVLLIVDGENFWVTDDDYADWVNRRLAR